MVAIKHDAGVAAWPHILPPDVIEQLPFPERWAAAVVDPTRASAYSWPADHRIVAFAGGASLPAMRMPQPPPTKLDAFFADPTAWGSGAGRAVLKAAVDERAGCRRVQRCDAVDQRRRTIDRVGSTRFCRLGAGRHHASAPDLPRSRVRPASLSRIGLETGSGNPHPPWSGATQHRESSVMESWPRVVPRREVRNDGDGQPQDWATVQVGSTSLSLCIGH